MDLHIRLYLTNDGSVIYLSHVESHRTWNYYLTILLKLFWLCIFMLGFNIFVFFFYLNQRYIWLDNKFQLKAKWCRYFRTCFNLSIISNFYLFWFLLIKIYVFWQVSVEGIRTYNLLSRSRSYEKWQFVHDFFCSRISEMFVVRSTAAYLKLKWSHKSIWLPYFFRSLLYHVYCYTGL